ncbi:WD40 repeat domain-containing protein [Candidatus Babeliales bacterium]|nr:WD40 repeat domain-containing protein [Candidatus Babeliales bacterium]
MKRSIFLVLTYFFYSGTTQCTLDFANQDATLIIDELSQVTVSRLKITNASQVTGWTQDSIIKSFVKSAASWTETYTAGVELGTGRRQPSTNMVVNNSNAINAWGRLTQNNSNVITSIAPLSNNNSNVIAAIARLELSNSNGIITLPTRIRANSSTILPCVRFDSNALRFGIKNNSNAIISLGFRVRANSNAAVALSRRIINNSNTANGFNFASTTLVRSNSNLIVFTRNQIATNIQNSNAINYFGNNVQIVSNHSRFQATTTINKIILYKAGFEVDAGKTLTLMTPLPVSGNIALKSTGKLVLAGDLYLNSNAYITSGGYLGGNNFSLVMSDSLVLSTLTTLQITSSLIIDGNGGTIVFGPHAQILLESNVSLTLKNVNIQTTRNALAIPIIRCYDQKGHVTFDNVNIALTDDFAWRTGRMFFYNDVRFTGTSKFIYQSWMQSYVMPQSLLTFDPGTTLYYYPSSTDKTLLQLTDKSSGIYFKGSGTTLQTTHTGMRLTKGRLWMDNKVTLSTQAATTLDVVTQIITQDYGTFVESVDFSPDDRFIAVSGNSPPSGNELQIFRFTGTSVSLVDSADVALAGATSFNAKWSPDGRFLAVTGSTEFYLYSFNGTTLTQISSLTIATSTIPRAIWSPDGKYIAVNANIPISGNEVQIYRFNGPTAPTLVTGADIGTANLSGSSWHPTGNYLAIGTTGAVSGGNELRLYSFNGSTLSLATSIDFGGASSFIGAVVFNPAGNFLAVGGLLPTSTFELQIYSFYGGSLTLIDSKDYSTSATGEVREIAWDPSGNYIAIVGREPINGDEIQFYKFDGSALTLVTSSNYGTAAIGVAWSHDGKYVAIGGNVPDSGHDEFEIYSTTFRFDTSTQALTNGLVFGNSALGSTSDVDVFFLAGARVQLDGKLFYNNVS